MRQKSFFFCMMICAFNLCIVSNSYASESPQQIHQEVKSILSNPEFRPPTKTGNIFARPLETINSWLNSIGNGIHKDGHSLLHIFERWWKYFKKFLPHSKNAGMRGLVSRDMVFALVITLIIVGIILLVVILFRLRNKMRKSQPKSVMVEMDEEDVENPDAEKWINRARDLVELSDFRSAYRAIFIAILSLLHEHQFLHLQVSRSNGEYVREVHQKSIHKIYLKMRDAADDFDLRWYGHRQIRKLELDYLEGIYNSLAHDLENDNAKMEMVG